MTTSLYVRIRGHVQGPHDFDVLKRLVQRGELGRFHDVSEDQQKWVKAATYAELFSPAVSYAATTEAETQGAVEVASSSGEEVYLAPIPQEVAAWYFSTSSEEQGPITSSEIRQMLAQGTLRPWNEVWCEAMEDWTELRFVSEFSADMQGMRTTKPFLQRYGMALVLGFGFGMAIILICSSIFILLIQWSSPSRRDSSYREVEVPVPSVSNRICNIRSQANASQSRSMI